MVARGKRLCAQPPDQVRQRKRALKGRKHHQRALVEFNCYSFNICNVQGCEVLYAFQAGFVIIDEPRGGAPSLPLATCRAAGAGGVVP